MSDNRKPSSPEASDTAEPSSVREVPESSVSSGETKLARASRTPPPVRSASRTSGSAPSARLPPPTGSTAPLLGVSLRDTYRVIRQIGEGGMSEIYEAHHSRLAGRRFAIKVLRPQLANSQAIRERFQREIRAVASISHPAVVGVFDYGSTPEGWPYMVSEFYEGLDIRACLGKYGRLSVPVVLEIGRVLGEALAATHDQGVIHRDLKPSNVFLEGDFQGEFPKTFQVKLLDFGLSRFLQAEARTTASGLVLGTPSYMAPEQAHGQGGDELSDVYGLGAVLYAAATGEAPFSGDSVKQTLLQVMTRKPVRPAKLCPAIPEGLEVVIQRAMARVPSDRYSTMTEMVVALANLQGRPTSRKAVARATAPIPLPAELPVRVLYLLWLGALGAVGTAWIYTGVLALPAIPPQGLARIGLGAGLATAGLAGGGVLVISQFRPLLAAQWGDTAWVARACRQVRGVLLTGLVAYGGGWLAVAFAAGLPPHWLRFVTEQAVQPLGWPGWASILSLVAALWMVVGVWRQRAEKLRRERQHRASLWAGFAVATGALAASVALGSLGLHGATPSGPSQPILGLSPDNPGR